MCANVTPRERLLAALAHEEADRVPVHPRFNDLTLLRMFGVPKTRLPANWRDQVLNWLGVEDVIYGVSLDPPRRVGYRVKRRIVETHTDYETILTEYITPVETLKSRVRRGFYDADKIAEQLAKDFDKDLEALRYLWRCDHDKRTAKGAERVRKTAVKEGKGILRGGGGSAWNMVFDAYGMVEMIKAAYGKPDLLREALEAAQEDLMAQTRATLEKTDVDIINIGAHAPAYLSPELFQKFVYPYERRVAELAREYGAYAIYHLDGKGCWALETLRAMGTTVLETIDPPPLGDFNMADAKRRIGDEVCFLGGVDSMTIWSGTPKEVENLTRGLIAEGAPEGGLIAGTGDSPPLGTPLANMQALVKTAKAVGRYPLRD